MYWPYLCRLSALSWYLSAGLTTGARSAPSAVFVSLVSFVTHWRRHPALNRNYEKAQEQRELG